MRLPPPVQLWFAVDRPMLNMPGPLAVAIAPDVARLGLLALVVNVALVMMLLANRAVTVVVAVVTWSNYPSRPTGTFPKCLDFPWVHNLYEICP